MQKQQAINIVHETFESAFDKVRFTNFIKNLLNEPDLTDGFGPRSGQYIPDAYKGYVEKYERLGKYEDEDEKRIDILIVHLKRDTSIERARSMQRNFVAGYLQGKYGSDAPKDAALVAFVSPNGEDWRFSLVKLEVRLDAGDDGKLKVTDEFTPAKRWSFLVGSQEKSHTAQRQFVPIMQDTDNNPTLAQLEEAFNIETVTKEFFNAYRALFIRTKGELDKLVKKDAKVKADFDSKGIDTVNLAKKLLGQIVFLYYLQKKGWFGVPRDAAWGEGSRAFLRELFEKKHGEYKNFFNDVLEPLFYEALRIDRSHDDHYYSRFDCKIPFLNGGLFDPMNNYDWVKTDLLLPNELFSNRKGGQKIGRGDPAPTEEGDGILDVFDLYNFTVKEDEPFEKEVAIDPELLGKAYEKFNAIRPDNYAEFLKALESGKKGEESKFNKQYGVYYTPREIVHYMCQQSLINYLYTELNPHRAHQGLGQGNLDMFGNAGKQGQLEITTEHAIEEISKEDIALLIQHGENWRENEERVNAAGKETETYSYKIPESIRKNASLLDEKLAAIKVCDPAVGSGAFPVGMMSEIVKARQALLTYTKTKKTPYDFKRECIENSLYGVDIDSGAVEIAKLRLWLSLVVDEDDPQNIKPLPNLDYKIVCGNSLIGFPENWGSSIEKEIETLIHLHFNETNPKKKSDLKVQIDEKLEARYKNSLRAFGYQINFDFRTVFSEVFQKKGGFDVVIANPPYITYHGRRRVLVASKELEFLKKSYVCAFEKQKDGKYNSAMFFIEKFVRISRQSGLLCCITDISFYEHFYQGLKKYLLESTKVINVVNGLSSFENVASGQLILIASKSSSKDDALENIVKINNEGIYSEKIFVKQSEWYNPENKYQFFIPENRLNDLYQKFEYQNKPLEFYFPNKLIRTGESVGVKEKGFVINDRPSDSKVPIYEYLEGGKSLSERYAKPEPTRYFRLDVKLLNEKNEAYRNDAIKNKRKNPKVLGIGDRLAFDNPKILIRQSSNHLCCTYTNKPYAYNRSYYSISNINSSGKSEINLLYILALLNSTLFTFYARKKRIIRMEQGKQPQIRLEDIKMLPVKMIKNSEQKPFIKLVDQILAAKGKNPQADTSKEESAIDEMVYQLYGLTEDEVKIVEGK